MGLNPVAAVVRPDDAALAAHLHLYGDTHPARLMRLAEALTSSQGWPRLREQAALAVRPDAGLIGILGAVYDEDRPLVDALGTHVADLLRRLLPVSYLSVEEACADVASAIRTRLTAGQLAGAHLVAVPRGGLIVGALLAYELDIPAARVGAVAPDDAVTILVDDCAISGTRLGEQVLGHRGSPLLVAVLHAHPAVCRTIEAMSSDVIACLTARELSDHAPMRPDYEAWRERWAKRHPQDLWTGDPDHVVYPWNEPDALIWNPLTARSQPGWRVVPPGRCTKNRAAAHLTDIQTCAPAPGPVMPADRVVWATVGDATLLAGLDDPRAVALHGSSGAMWEAIVATGSADRAAVEVAGRYDAPPGRVRADLDRFIGQLADRQLLRLS